MGLVVGIFWIVFGVGYIIYKFGSEELEGGAKGGILMLLIPIAVVAVLGGVPYVLSLVFGDYGVIGFQILLAIGLTIGLAFLWVGGNRKEKKDKRKMDEHYKEIEQRIHSKQEKK